MHLRDISASQHRLLRDVTAQISNRLETEFSELPGVDSPRVGIVLRERHRHVLIEIPVELLVRATGDLSAREAIRVHIKSRRDRMLFRAPPKPLPKHIAAAATPGFMHFGFGYRRGSGPRGRR